MLIYCATSFAVGRPKGGPKWLVGGSSWRVVAVVVAQNHLDGYNFCSPTGKKLGLLKYFCWIFLPRCFLFEL